MQKKILIIDDDPSILAMVEGILKSGGYTVRSTVDPAKGVRLTSEWKPDLILLDIMMPEMDGYSAARLIRGFCSMPIIFLSAKAEEEEHKFIPGLPRHQKWIRITPSPELSIEKLKVLAEELCLSFKVHNDGHLLVYGEDESVKDFVKKVASEYKSRVGE